MPLPNNPNFMWNGYLVEDLSGASRQFLQYFQKQIDEKNLPKVTTQLTKVNMWWRSDSPCVDIKSKIDGEVQCTIHVMEYGAALFIGIATAPVNSLGNYYKRMAASCFVETVDLCICRAIELTSDEILQRPPRVITIGTAGKFGG